VKRVQQEAIVLFYLYFARTETILESVFACSGQSTGLLRASKQAEEVPLRALETNG
jgi:hypothetical protein